MILTTYGMATATFLGVVVCFSMFVTLGTVSAWLVKRCSKRDSSYNTVSLVVLSAAGFFLAYPPVFIAVDIMDLGLCPPGKIIFWFPGDITGCNIPSSVIWQVLLGANVILSIFSFPVLITWFKCPNWTLPWRALAASGAGVAVAALYLLVGLVFYEIDKLAMQPAEAALLLSSGTAFREVADLTSCPAVEPLELPASVLNGSTPSELCAVLPHQQSLQSAMDYEAGFLDMFLSFFLFSGYFLFAPFAGIGFFLHPWDLIVSFATHPPRPVPKAEFIRRGRSIVSQAMQIKAECSEIEQETKLGRSAVTFRRRAASLKRQVLELEKEDHLLHRVFPAGEDPELVWTMRTLGKYGMLAWGVVSAAISAAWVFNTAVFILPSRPVSPGINVFIAFVRSESLGAYFLNIGDLLVLLLLLLHVQQCTNAGLRHAQELLNLGIMSPAHSKRITVLSHLRNAWPMTVVLQAQLQWMAFSLAGAVANTSFMEVTAPERGMLRLIDWIYSKSLFSWIIVTAFACTAVTVPVRFYLRQRASRRFAVFISSI